MDIIDFRLTVFENGVFYLLYLVAFFKKKDREDTSSL